MVSELSKGLKRPSKSRNTVSCRRGPTGPSARPFHTIDNAALSSRVDSMQDRMDEQQAARDRITSAWRWLYVGIGVVLTLLSFTFTQGMVLFLAYWTGGYFILVAIRRLYLEPHLEAKYPLSRRRESRRTQRQKQRATASPVPDERTSGADQ